jgi:hypothetical protein
MNVQSAWLDDFVAAFSAEPPEPSKAPRSQYPNEFPHDLPRVNNWMNGMKGSLDNINVSWRLGEGS